MDQKLINAVLDPKVEFFILANEALKEMILKNEHPAIKPMPESYKAVLLDGLGAAVDNRMVLSYLNGTMDPNSRYVFDHCEIRIVGDPGARFNLTS